MIRVQHVSHWFGKMQVLRDVSMHVPAGEIFGFIGPNGAGKTTTIRMMATLLEPDEGRVLVDGHDVSHATRSITLTPREATLELDLVHFDGTTVDGEATLRVPPATHDALVALGWTPPAGGDG